MSLATVNTELQGNSPPGIMSANQSRAESDQNKVEGLASISTISAGRRNSLVRFITELRRRQVCRTATIYAVVLWLICQIIDLVYIELGLPDWTLKFVIVLGLLGLPITLILSWLIDITPDGLVLDAAGNSARSQVADAGSRRLFDCIIDGGLVLAAMAIGIQLATGGLSPQSDATTTGPQKIAVLTFGAASGNGAEMLSAELTIELQHELNKVADVLVIASKEPYLTKDSQILSGRVAIDENQVRVTATMTSNGDGSITWSQVFHQPRTDSLLVPSNLARDIVEALPLSYLVSATSLVPHAT
jgi:TolB-like protein